MIEALTLFVKLILVLLFLSSALSLGLLVAAVLAVRRTEVGSAK